MPVLRVPGDVQVVVIPEDFGYCLLPGAFLEPGEVEIAHRRRMLPGGLLQFSVDGDGRCRTVDVISLVLPEAGERCQQQCKNGFHARRRRGLRRFYLRLPAERQRRASAKLKRGRSMPQLPDIVADISALETRIMMRPSAQASLASATTEYPSPASPALNELRFPGYCLS